jgi:hypothetical protein
VVAPVRIRRDPRCRRHPKRRINAALRRIPRYRLEDKPLHLARSTVLADGDRRRRSLHERLPKRPSRIQKKLKAQRPLTALHPLFRASLCLFMAPIFRCLFPFTAIRVYFHTTSASHSSRQTSRIPQERLGTSRSTLGPSPLVPRLSLLQPSTFILQPSLPFPFCSCDGTRGQLTGRHGRRYRSACG